MSAIYKHAQSVLDGVAARRGTVASLALRDRVPQRRAVYALSMEVLKYRAVVERMLVVAKVKKRLSKINPTLVAIMAYDLVIGPQKRVQGGGAARHAVVGVGIKLRAALGELMREAGVDSPAGLLPEHVRNPALLPRYVRVNTIRATVADVVRELCDQEGFREVQDVDEVAGASKSDGVFARDPVITGLLVFPPATPFHGRKMLEEGRIVVQDRASCLPAFVLSPKPGDVVLDACAAPGNKTTHLAAIMNNTGKVIAFDADARRLGTLRRNAERCGASCIEASCQDFLKTDPGEERFRDVSMILLDPSCSGSGMPRTVEEPDPEPTSEERLKALAEFQEAAILHAFKFPSVRRVSYSTCSVHREENEGVVDAVLRAQSRFVLEHANREWPGRAGEHGECLRGGADVGSIGFFVAVFRTVQSSI